MLLRIVKNGTGSNLLPDLSRATRLFCSQVAAAEYCTKESDDRHNDASIATMDAIVDFQPMTDDITIVYLDQCVLSRFVQEPGDDGWKNVHSLLIRGVEAGRLICPHSLEHLVETAAMPRNDAIATDDILRKLSRGWSLCEEPVLVATQIASCIRKTSLSRIDAFRQTKFRPLSDEGTYNCLHTGKRALDSYNVRKMAPQNELHKVFRNDTQGDETILLELARLGNRSYTCRFIDELKTSLDDGLPHVTFREDAPQMPTEFSFITAILIKTFNFGLNDLRLLDAQLRKSGVVFIPFYFSKVSLEACHRWKQKNRDHGDQYDVTRLSCALPFVDLVVTDGSAASAVRDVGLDKHFNARVLSTKAHERCAIVQALEEIFK